MNWSAQNEYSVKRVVLNMDSLDMSEGTFSRMTHVGKILPYTSLKDQLWKKVQNEQFLVQQ